MTNHRMLSALPLFLLLSSVAWGTELPELEPLLETTTKRTDCLIDNAPYKAGIYRTHDPREFVLDNGLVRRTFRTAPNGATVALENLMTGQSLLRGVKPEAVVTIDGRKLNVGGLDGQPNYAYLLPEWLDGMTADAGAMQLTGFEIGAPVERFAWKQVRRHAPNVAWPPKGVALRMDYALPDGSGQMPSPSDTRPLLWSDTFKTMDKAWTIQASPRHERTSFENEGQSGQIYALSSTFCFADRQLPDGAGLIDVEIQPGTDRSTSWGPGMTLVYDGQTVGVRLRTGDRGVHGHFEMRVNGRESLKTIDSFAAEDGGLSVDSNYRLRVVLEAGRLTWYAAKLNEKQPIYERLFTIDVPADQVPKMVRIGKTDRQGGPSDEVKHPGELGRCRFESIEVYGQTDAAKLQQWKSARQTTREIQVSVHYELFDGVPVISKWITVHNGTEKPITVDRFTSEMLAIVEYDNPVEAREGYPLSPPDSLHVETDFAFQSFNHGSANRHVVHWKPDPQYTTQVNYLKETPCLLTVEPTYGPSQDIAPGATFTSCRAFELVYDSTERERRGLALRKMYRTIAPWVTENPLMHHLLSSDPEVAKRAVDQAAEVGFEMLILSFGSGFNMDNEDPAYLAKWKEVADYAHAKGIEIGSYSLLSSRGGVPASDMIVSPPGERPTHGQCPALTSEWGQAYFQRMRRFYELTGFDLLEHDGSYPGDVDVTPRPPLQKGKADSRWVQWRIISDYYHWCRERGIYLNVPDYYFLSGSNKCGMGYREVNWSLPREMQVLHTRQNIYDGTWDKTPSMGWMFVPLSQYHGGGPAATVEPLHEHLDHYQAMILSNLGSGVQACYRGPRLYDTDETKAVVKQSVDWFKHYRDILESDVIHGRRADGRDVDWLLHVNPALPQKGMLVVFNPLNEPVERTLRVPLYYTGLTETATVSSAQLPAQSYELDRQFTIELPVTIPAKGMGWFVIE